MRQHRHSRRETTPLASPAALAAFAALALAPLASGCATAVDPPAPAEPAPIAEAPILSTGMIGGGTVNLPPPLIVVAPYGLARTASPARCLAHTSNGPWDSWICTRNMDIGNIVLTWSWWNACPWGSTCASSVDRYDVYRSVNGAIPTSVASVPSTQTYAATVAPPAGAHTCYYVAAVSGSVSSRLSAVWCTDGMSPNVLSRRVDPNFVNTWHQWDRGGRMVGPPDYLAGAQMVAGFSDDYDGGNLLLSAESSYDWWRGGATFDVSDAAMAEPRAATLAFHSLTTSRNWSAPANCATNVDVLDDPISYGYWSIPNLSPSNGFPRSHAFTSAPSTTSDVSVPVTSAVSDWIARRSNTSGFSLRGPRETGDADSTTCVSQITNLHLQIDYYDQTWF